MTIQDWPHSIFPDVQLEIGADVASAVLRGSEDSVAQQRQRFTGEFHTFRVRWCFTDEQYNLFQAFHFYKLHQGTAWFQIDLPGKTGFINRRARFQDGVFDAELNHPHWVVRATLEVEKGAS